MNISMQLVVVVAAVCICLAETAPETRMARKSQRPTRGFKNVEMMTARGFGKRNNPTRTEQMGMENFWTMLESPDPEGVEAEDKIESIRADWFVNEMMNNREFTKSVVRKFIDLDQDGYLTLQELLRNA